MEFKIQKYLIFLKTFFSVNRSAPVTTPVLLTITTVTNKPIWHGIREPAAEKSFSHSSLPKGSHFGEPGGA